MPSKRHLYDINIIEDLESQGFSIREIARQNGWPETNTHHWLNRNYPFKVTKKLVKYYKTADDVPE